MKEHPTFHDLHHAIDGCRKFLRGIEPLRLHPYKKETLEDFSDRLPKDKVWQLSFNKYGRFMAEEVLGLDDERNTKELRDSTPDMESHVRKTGR